MKFRRKSPKNWQPNNRSKRADGIIKIWEKWTDLKNQLHAINPKPTQFDADGKPIGVLYFSKEDNDKRKKLKEQIERCENAVNKAINQKDYSDVDKLTSGKDKDESGGDTK